MIIADIRAELVTLSMALSCPRLSVLADELRRRSPKARAKAKANPLTPAVKADIRALRAAYPDMTQFEIAEKLGVNQGRVSETLRGKRT